MCWKCLLALFSGHPLALGRGVLSKLWAPQQILSSVGDEEPISTVTVGSRSIRVVWWASLGPLQSNSACPHSLLLLCHSCSWRHLPYLPLFTYVRIWDVVVQTRSFSQYWYYWLNFVNLPTAFAVVVMLVALSHPHVGKSCVSMICSRIVLFSSLLLKKNVLLCSLSSFSLEISWRQWMRCSVLSSDWCHTGDLWAVCPESWLFHSSELRLSLRGRRQPYVEHAANFSGDHLVGEIFVYLTSS